MQTVKYPFEKKKCRKCGVEDYQRYMFQHGSTYYCPHCETGFIKFKKWFTFFLVVGFLLIIGLCRQSYSASLPLIYYSPTIHRLTMWGAGFKTFDSQDGFIGTMKCYDKLGNYTGETEVIVLLSPRYDVNGDGRPNMLDLTRMVNHFFRGKP